MGTVSDDSEFVLQRTSSGDRRGENKAGVIDAVLGEFQRDRFGLAEQRGEIDSRQTRGHQTERGQCGEPSTHVGISVEHSVAVGAR